MTDTTQLKALRDAARTMRDFPNVADSMIGAYLGIECAADRAITSLEAAEQPKACAEFVCEFGETNESCAKAPECNCTCGLPLSAHQQPPAEQPKPALGNHLQLLREEALRSQQTAYAPALTPYSQPIPVQPARKLVHGPEHGCAQPARADVPSLMLPPPALSAVTHVAFETHEAARREAERQHAACVRIARERDEARRELEQERAKSGQYEAKLTALEEAVREELPEYDLDGEGEATADEVERIEYAGEELRKAEAELAALKGQEPVGEVVDLGDADGDFTCAALKRPLPSLGALLYAAPVASIPLAQHEAEVAQAGREERERCAKVCSELAEDARETRAMFESRYDEVHAKQWDHRVAQAFECGRLIRALPDAGGEGGK